MVDGYIRLKSGIITVGKPLLFNVYDAQGTLLLQQGYVISSREQLDRLYERGLFHASHAQTVAKKTENAPVVVDEKKLNPFLELPVLLEELELLLSHIVSQHEDAERRLKALATRLIRLGRDDPDACLAVVHLNTIEPSSYEQTLYHALLAFMVATHLNWSAEDIQTLLMASLTANIALLPFQDKLNRSRNPLTEVQRAVLRKHPDLSAAALEKAGCLNPVLLQAVRQHHEHPKGTGYPLGLKGNQISLHAQILGMTERYTAMVSQRAYRPRMSVGEAQRELSHHASDPQLFVALYGQLTPFPPGTFVELANGETAVVTQRGKLPQNPRVRAIINAKGVMYHGSFTRDTADPELAVKGFKTLSMPPSLNPVLIWGSG